MPSHIHLIFRSGNGDPSALMRDFKGFTSKKMLQTIEENTQESRREWMHWMMERAGKKNSNVTNRQFWQQDNHPIEIWSLKVFEQKLDYIGSSLKVVGKYYISIFVFLNLDTNARFL